MTNEEAITALHTIIDALVEDETNNAEIKKTLDHSYQERQVVPAKGILADCNKYQDKEIHEANSQEISALIKKVYFYFA